jgi:hypothetical protein
MRYIAVLLASFFISTTIFAQLGNPKKIKLDAINHATRSGIIGDIDGDGIDDALFVPYQLEGENVVYRKGILNYPFLDAVEIFVTNQAGTALLADFDGDGDLDIFLCLQTRTSGVQGFLKILYNDGSGNFDSSLVLDDIGNSGGRQAANADIDDDGDQDIVYTVLDAPGTEFPSGTIWLENDGEGVFERHVLGTNRAYAIALGDITNDSRTDVVITEVFDDRITIYENMDNIDFEFRRSRNVKEFPSEIFLADFNGDNLMDMVISAADVTRYISYYENKGQSNLAWNQTTINNSSMRPSTNIEIADFDGDDDVDIVWSSLNAENLGWYSNDGNGVFSDQGILLSGQKTYVIDLVDANNDGFPDFYHHSQSNGFSGLALNDGNGGLDLFKFNTSRKLNIPVYSKAFQNDADAEEEVLVVNQESGFVHILDDLEVDPASLTQVFYDEFSQPFQGDAYDADGDSDADVLVLYLEGLVLFNRENGAYTTQVLPNSDVADYFEIYDFNDDGVDDVIASSSSDQSIYAWYSEDGQYLSRSLVADDLSSNTKFAVVSSSSGSLAEGLVYTDNNGNVVNLPYTGGGAFGLPVTIRTTELDFILFAVADVDGDELDDLVVANDIGMFRLMNAGSGELEVAALVDFEADLSEFFLDDITNNGLVDLVAYRGGNGDVIRFYENLGSGLFFLEKQWSNNDVQSVTTGDFDGDGVSDLVATESAKNRAFLIKSNYPASALFSGLESENTLSEAAISVYPNPAVLGVRVSDPQVFEDELIHASIFDVQGRLVFQDQNISKYDEINISILPFGIYTIMLTETENRTNHFVKLVKK